jgi:hypothetical protein
MQGLVKNVPNFQRKVGVRNSITTVPDTFNGRAVKDSATRKSQPSSWPRKSHGPTKILSKSVVALLPFTVLATRVKTLLKL